MLDMATNVSKSAGKVMYNNILTIAPTLLAISLSAIQHLTGDNKNGKPTASDIASVSFVTFLAVIGIWQAYNAALSTIPAQLGGKNEAVRLRAHPPATELAALERFARNQKSGAIFSFREVIFVQFLITLVLLLTATYAKLPGIGRFFLDAFFYITEAVDYARNLQVQQDIRAMCIEKFQPAGLHEMLEPVVPPPQPPAAGGGPVGAAVNNAAPADVEAGNNLAQPPAVAAAAAPTGDRRRSIAEILHDRLTRRQAVLRIAPEDIVAVNAEVDENAGVPNSDVDSVSSSDVDSVSSSDVDSDLDSGFNSSSSSSLETPTSIASAPRDMIQSESRSSSGFSANWSSVASSASRHSVSVSSSLSDTVSSDEERGHSLMRVCNS